MGITLPLDKMTVAEKLEVMEALWNDLSQNSEDVSSPEWHEDVLMKREQAIKNGEEKFSDWEIAKDKILKSLS